MSETSADRNIFSVSGTHLDLFSSERDNKAFSEKQFIRGFFGFESVFGIVLAPLVRLKSVK
jgi:hypothetical protein